MELTKKEHVEMGEHCDNFRHRYIAKQLMEVQYFPAMKNLFKQIEKRKGTTHIKFKLPCFLLGCLQRNFTLASNK